MSEVNNTPAKRSHQKNLFAFPTDLEIPESALSDRKFRLSYVRIFNDPRVYKRPRLNGDRTSSRFDVDYNYQIKVVFDEPIVKRKSILANTQCPKDDSSISKSVSFSSKITFIDSNLDGVSSDCSDVEVDDSGSSKSKTKSKTKTTKNGKSENKLKKSTAAASNGKPSSKNKKRTKDKPANKNGHKVKSTQKELFKFKITKPFRKFGRSKDKKLKHLQKKFGRRMFKAFVQVKRSFNLKTIPEQVTVPLEKITLNTNDVTTPQKSVPSIQDFLISRMTKTVKVSLTPVQDNTGDTNEPMIIDDSEIIQCKESELNSTESVDSSSRPENDVQSDKTVDRQEMADDSETNQNLSVVPSADSSNSNQLDQSGQSIKSNGDPVPVVTDDCPDVNIDKCNDAEPSPGVLEISALPNLIDEITCSMFYKDETVTTNGQVDDCHYGDLDGNNTRKDETVTTNGQVHRSDTDDHHHCGDSDENISTFNVSFSIPTKSVTDNMLGCDSPAIASIQLEMND